MYREQENKHLEWPDLILHPFIPCTNLTIGLPLGLLTHQGWFHSGGSKGKSISLPLPALRGHQQLLAHGSLPLSSKAIMLHLPDYSSHFLLTLLFCLLLSLLRTLMITDVFLSKLWELVMDREAWRATDHGVTKSRTWLSDWTELMITLRPLW